MGEILKFAAIVIGGALVVALVLSLILAALACGVVSGLLAGSFACVSNFIRSFVAHIGFRTGSIEDHARVCYFWWKGDWGRNAIEICKDTWENNIDRIRNTWDDIQNELASFEWDLEFSCLAGITKMAFFIATIIGLTLSSSIIFPICLILYFLVFLAIWVLYSTTALAIRGFSFCVDKFYGLFNLCRSCHHKTDVPIYVCPKCGVEHVRLVPTAKFGPFSRRCQCGENLPVIPCLGRTKLQALCPTCKLPMDNATYAPTTIVLVGGSSVGKSLLVMDSVVAIKERLASEIGQLVTIPPDDAPKVEDLVRCYNEGVFPNITPDTAIEAICLQMKAAIQAFPRRLYLYDPPGESFHEAAKIVRHRYYAHMQAVIFVIDPSTIPEVMAAYEEAGTSFSIQQIGAQSAEESFNRWLIGMEQEYPDLVSKTICAAVISKADEPALSRIVGITAGDGDEKCRDFLCKFGNGNLLSVLDSYFHEVRCFAVGTVGSGGNGKTFTPVGLDELLKWVLNEIL